MWGFDLNRKRRSVDHVNLINLIKCKYYKASDRKTPHR
jgi:hypothetical protein